MSHIAPTLRTLTATACALLAPALWATAALAQEATPPAAEVTGAAVEKAHALSLVGAPAYGADFKQFGWVNPDAPKGGKARLFVQGTFDSLNPFTLKGNQADGLALTYDSLLMSSPDEPSTEYGLIAEWVSHPADFSSVTFGLRPEAKFHDGTPVTAEDVVFSLDALKKAHPQYAFYYANVVKAEKTGDREVTFRFDKTGNRELPLIVGQLPVLSKQFWTDNDITKTTLKPPLGSGPYKVKTVSTGRSIVYERDPNYWAKDLPVAKGQWNFGEVGYEYFRDRVPGFESFKNGQVDMWDENSAGSWATGYNVPPVTSGKILKREFPHKRVAGMQGFVPNLRRPQFQNPALRQALTMVFNFEQLNKSLFYGSYTRTNSYFDNSELAATGTPQGRELAFLEKVRANVPEAVFGPAWSPPDFSDPTAQRKSLREALGILRAAGYKLENRKLLDPNGTPVKAEFLLVSEAFEKIVLPYIADLNKIGIDATVATVDASQYKLRLDTRDFDIVVGNFGQSHSPGNEQRDFWGSEAADRNGSRNIAGIKNPAIDTLIDEIVFAKSREDLVAATRALDRVLLWNNYVVPQWHLTYDRMAYWKKFAHPTTLPSQTPAFLQTWWVGEQKEATSQAAN